MHSFSIKYFLLFTFSGQHLITAVIDTKFGYQTTSWDLGKTVSYIELDTPKMNKEEITEAERYFNAWIATILQM